MTSQNHCVVDVVSRPALAGYLGSG